MQMETKGDWGDLFTVEQVQKPLNVEVGECNQNCQEARELVCVCKCKGKNHGAALRQNVKPLDAFEDPTAQTFSPEEYLEELAVLT